MPITKPEYVTQADIQQLILDTWPEAEHRLASTRYFPREYNPTKSELREAHAAVAATEIWRLIRQIVGADDTITFNTKPEQP